VKINNQNFQAKNNYFSSTEPRHLMNKFRKKRIILSFGTEHTYISCFCQIKRFLDEKKLGSLSNMSKKTAIRFLKKYRHIYQEPTLKKYRQALQHILRHNNKLGENEILTIFASKIESVQKTRAYSLHEVMSIIDHMNERDVLSVMICFYAGLRAHELLEIRRIKERAPDTRPSEPTKFFGEKGVFYTVKGKGGLIRVIILPFYLAVQLEKRRLESKRKVKDRKIMYESYYDLNGGKNLSNRFSVVSKRVLGYSRGLHGLRHSFAQCRYRKLISLTKDKSIALQTVSQELGHFRPEITLVYLR